MKARYFISTILFTVFLVGCETDVISPSSLNPKEGLSEQNIGLRGRCVSTMFCLQLSGSVTSEATDVDNCVTNKTKQIIVSTSAGDNDPMVFDLEQISSCFGVVSGTLSITEERSSGLGKLQSYFPGDNGQAYVFITRGVMSGDWIPAQSGESATVDFSGMDWEIKRSGKGKGKNDACVDSGTFSATSATIATVAFGLCER